MNRILLVDANKHLQKQLNFLLSDLKNVFVAAAVSDGYEALEWLKEYAADICITGNLMMSVMDGIQLIEAIHKHYPWMQCIVLTSHHEIPNYSKCMLLGDVTFMLKPLEASQVIEVMERIMIKINMERRYAANHLLLTHLPQSINIVDSWCDMVLSVHAHVQPLLIADTLKMFEGWVGKRIEILAELSLAWVSYIVEVLKKRNIHVSYQAGEAVGNEASNIHASDFRHYFRLGAIRHLEEAANLFIERSRKAKSVQRDNVVDHVKDYIEVHFDKKISLDELAEHAAVSRSHMAAIFKKQIGMTIWTYCTSVRMRKAREYLLTSSLRCYEIALKVGYQNSIHFSRIFKQYHGMNPMDYKGKFSS